MSTLKDFFTIQAPSKLGLSTSQQRQMWFTNFIQAFLVVVVVYATMYLIRNNFKASSGMLKDQLGFTTTQLGQIGLGFSITYGIGKTLLGYLIDGKPAKRILSVLLILSAFCILVMGILLSFEGRAMGFLILFWGLSGFFQSVGGPASYATIMKWTPRAKRGRWLGAWNTSHNIGGAFAGMLALWGANIFFSGHVWGMFIVPAIVALLIGIASLFIGKECPEELGMDSCETIFEEKIEKDTQDAATLSKWQIFTTYVLCNKWVWILCIANVFVYIVRIGIDNWAPLYTKEMFHFTSAQQVNTIFYFEIGALIASLTWGYVSDIIGGRRALIAGLCLILTAIAVLGYRYGHTPLQINTSLFCLGALIFGPQLLIGVSVVHFVPKQAVMVTNGTTGTFAYLFGDSLAKVGLAAIADPSTTGLHFFGTILHGWNDTFLVFYTALIAGVILLAYVAVGEEIRLRKNL
ncbi:MAG: hexose-6-phosphate:phosphate antiporter [Proteobacteria bacterium]|nr:MAG: hexose-6-phosphate:phosphate antiporter [Pseudomonadota bacterium]